MFGNGMGYNDMVGRVFMSLCLVDFHACVSFHVLFLQRKNLDIKLIFNGRNQTFYCFPSLG